VAYLMFLSQDRIQKMSNTPQMSHQVRRYSRRYSSGSLLQVCRVIYRWSYSGIK